MDDRGNIRQIPDGEQPKMNEVPLDKLPDPKCEDCFGRGFQRRLIENITVTEPCHCTKVSPFDKLKSQKPPKWFKP